jgi:putative YphP/YqiW family bacilliredoxin
MQPLYDREAVRPMWEELAQCGVAPLRTVADVDTVLDKSGTALIVVNSVCGCAAGSARPGVTKALQSPVIPDHLTTVFAGVDREATERSRERMAEVPPSSPSVALFKDGTLVYALSQNVTETAEGKPAQKVEIVEPVQQDDDALAQHMWGKLIETSYKRHKLYGMESPMLQRMADEAGVDLEEAMGDKRPNSPEGSIGEKQP